jgi:hypothetical protein
VAAGTCTIEAFQLGNADYEAAPSAIQHIHIGKATPIITWANPAAITWGTKLSSTQLDATATLDGNTVAGSFTYTPGSGTVLSPGNNQTLSVSFAPTDTADYNNAAASVLINVGFNPAACLTKSFNGPLTIGSGQASCVGTGATITSGVTISTGGALYMTGGTIKGSLMVNGASAIYLCGVTVSGGITITGSTGPIMIGGSSSCKNMISGSVSITHNTGGITTYQNNMVSGTLTITNNTGGVGTISGTGTSGSVNIANNH